MLRVVRHVLPVLALAFGMLAASPARAQDDEPPAAQEPPEAEQPAARAEPPADSGIEEIVVLGAESESASDFRQSRLA